MRCTERELLARIHLSDSERRAAEHDLAVGERVAEFIVDAVGALSALQRAMERAFRSRAGSSSTG